MSADAWIRWERKNKLMDRAEELREKIPRYEGLFWFILSEVRRVMHKGEAI